jgi:AraC family transcriptional regulator
LESKYIIQNTLDTIDNRITENITPQELAKACGYSTSRYNRIFSSAMGITLMAYVTRRKLQYALFDLSCGEKIIDIAFKYGFETHAGFTRAFKSVSGIPRLSFGFTPFVVGRREWKLTN